MDSATLLATIVGIIWNLLVFRKARQVWEKLHGSEPILNWREWRKLWQKKY